MALKFALAPKTNYVLVDHPDLHGLSDAFTVMVWVKFAVDATSTEQCLFSKKYDATDAAFYAWRLKSPDHQKLGFDVNRAGGWEQLRTANLFSIDVWYWLVFTSSGGTDPQVFWATVSAPPAEATYATRTNASGGLNNSGGVEEALNIGRVYPVSPDDGSWPFRGSLAFFGVLSERLSLAEARVHWPRPQKLAGVDWIHHAYSGYSALDHIDWSGGAGNGTLGSGVTRVAPPPIAAPLVPHLQGERWR